MTTTESIDPIFSPETVEILREIYSKKTAIVLEALKTLGQTFSVRINTLKTSREDILQQFEEEGWRPSPHPNLDEVILFPVDGPYELEGKGLREVVVDKYTAEAILRGADLFSPGIKQCHRLRRGDHAAIVAPNGVLVAIGVALMDQTEILRSRAGIAVRIEQSRYRIPSLRNHALYDEGLIYPQSLPSLLVARNLQPSPDEIIVDMNAAPGGKATHIAQQTANRARVLAFDRHAEKVEHLRQNLQRMGATCVETRIADSRYLYKDYPTLKADAVLVDPPCSALGIRPEVYDTTTRRKVQIVAAYQKQFLETAARILKPEGRIFYSTCTMTYEESEMQISSVCEKHGLSVAKQELILGTSGFDKFTGGADCQRFHPHQHDTPGFFIALLTRNRR